MDQDYGQKIYRLLVGVVVVGGLIFALWFVNQGKGQPEQSASGTGQTCGQKLNMLIAAQRQDKDFNNVMGSFAAQCRTEYKLFTNFLSIKSTPKGVPACTELEQYRIEPAAIELASREGYCTS